MSDAILTQDELVSMRRVVASSTSPVRDVCVVEVQRLDAEHESSYVSDLWSVRPYGRTTSPVQLTHGPYSDRAPAHDWNGDVLFLSDRPDAHRADAKASERAQIWRLPTRGGEPVQLSDEPLGVLSFCAAAQADVIVALAVRLPHIAQEEQREVATERTTHGPSARTYTSMPVRYWDHWIPEAAPQLVVWRNGQQHMLSQGEDRAYRNASFDVSACGRYVLITRAIFEAKDRLSETQLELHDLDAGTRRVLFYAPLTQINAVSFLAGSDYILAQCWERAQGSYGTNMLVEIEVSSGQRRTIPVQEDIWPTVHDVSDDGRTLLASAPWNGATPALLIDRQSGAVTRLTSQEDAGTHGSLCFLDEASAAVCIRSSIVQPPELFFLSLDAPAPPTQITRLSGHPIDVERLEVSSLMATSSDGEPCQYYVVKPRDACEPLPALVWIHGGPISDWGDAWHWRWNSLVGASRGYAMILPNPRGSTGFGQAWVEGIWGNTWGGQCHDDLLAVIKDVEAREDVQAGNVSVMGGSFGGYMTNWIGTQHARFRALVTHAGLYNLSAFHAITDSPAYWSFMMGEDPYTQHDAFSLYSPHRHVSRWKSPTLIIHGQQDYRVPVGEALSLFEALQYHGVESEFLLFPDENHWILKPRNIKVWYEQVFAFLDRHTREEPGA